MAGDVSRRAFCASVVARTGVGVFGALGPQPAPSAAPITTRVWNMREARRGSIRPQYHGARVRGRRQVVGGAKMHSALQILAADDLAAGPVARARLPHVMPLGFHGSWQPAG